MAVGQGNPREGLSEPVRGPEWGAASWLAALTWPGLPHPQGLAYVEYENESQASQAVLKMDGMTIRENVIKVAISNPPQRKVPEKPEARKAPGSALLPRQVYGA